MKTITKIRLLNSLGLFNILRSFYYQREAANKELLGFYSQFIPKGSLCFDVGANIGRKTDIFLNLGARVVAVEPNPECTRFLKRKYRNNPNVQIIDKALDTQEDQKELYLCETNSLSSLSPKWIEVSKKSGRAAEFHWDKKVQIKTTTLDNLIKEYGQPVFCKLDVEGYELPVLKGLTRPISYLSLELAAENVAMTCECIRYLTFLAPAAFNLAQGETARQLDLPSWIPSEQMISLLIDNPRYGELYVHLKHHSPTS